MKTLAFNSSWTRYKIFNIWLHTFTVFRITNHQQQGSLEALTHPGAHQRINLLRVNNQTYFYIYSIFKWKVIRARVRAHDFMKKNSNIARRDSAHTLPIQAWKLVFWDSNMRFSGILKNPFAVVRGARGSFTDRLWCLKIFWCKIRHFEGQIYDLTSFWKINLGRPKALYSRRPPRNLHQIKNVVS